MAQWINGYVVGAYGGAPGLGAAIPLDVPGPIRRIVSGFYIDRPGGVTGPPVPLTPVVTADGNDDVQISDPTTPAGKRAVKIYTGAALANPVIFLFCELELDRPGTTHAITA